MGKKARLRRYPQKFGRKFASHSYSVALNKEGSTDTTSTPSTIQDEELVESVSSPPPDKEKVQIKEVSAEKTVETPSAPVAESSANEVAKVAEVVDEVAQPAEATTKKTTRRKAPIKPRASRRKKKTAKKET